MRIVWPWVSFTSTPRWRSFSAISRPVPNAGSMSTPAHKPATRVAVTPWSTLVIESGRERELSIGADDAARLGRRWGTSVEADPYHNPNLPKYDLYPRMG